MKSTFFLWNVCWFSWLIVNSHCVAKSLLLMLGLWVSPTGQERVDSQQMLKLSAAAKRKSGLQTSLSQTFPQDHRGTFLSTIIIMDSEDTGFAWTPRTLANFCSAWWNEFWVSRKNVLYKQWKYVTNGIEPTVDFIQS